MSDSGYPPSEYCDSLKGSSRSKCHSQFDLTEIQASKLEKFPGYRKSPRITSSENRNENCTPRGRSGLNEEDFLNSYQQKYKKQLGAEFDDSMSRLPSGHSPYRPRKIEQAFIQRRASPSLPKVQQDNVTDDSRKQAQMQAYIAWVNVQLKKKAGSRSVEDLATDVRDGTVLINLIHIVADEELDDVHTAPSNREQMLHNVQQVIDFMRSRHIRMHHTPPTDIVDGNVKAIMRLILALAAHFKPNSVKQATGASKSTASQSLSQTVAGIAQGAVAALADARKDANRASLRPRRPKQLAQAYASSAAVDSGSDSESHTATGSHVTEPLYLRCADGASSAATSARTSPRGGATSSQHSSHRTPLGGGGFAEARTSDFRQPVEGREASADYVKPDLLREHAELETDMQETKATLLKLQQLLLEGRVADGAEDIPLPVEGGVSLPARGGCAEEELAILRARLKHSEEVCAQLRAQVSALRNETMQLQGVKAGLQQRLSEQEHSFLVMKAELLRAGFTQQALNTAKVDLEKKISEKDSVVMNLRRDLAKREREIDELQAGFKVEQHAREASAQALRSQIAELHSRLQQVGQTEASLSARVAIQDRKMARLEGKLMGAASSSSAKSTHSTSSSDEMAAVREGLQTLRAHSHGGGDQGGAIDALETSISQLMERVLAQQHVSPPPPHSNQPIHQMRRPASCRDVSSSSGGRTQSTYLSSSHANSSSNGNTVDTSVNGNFCTKVLYFTDRAVTPFMVTLPKRLGEICLRDIKTVVERPGHYRYHFKAMDPEFGTVKEEVLHDDDLVPGWEGKIVAWIEEDHG